MNETDIKTAELIMGKNFIGVEELKRCGMQPDIPDKLPNIPFTREELEEKKEGYRDEKFHSCDNNE